MGFDRSKFQAAKIVHLKEQQQQADSIRPKTKESSRPDYVSLEHGDNIVRIFPPHPGTSSYIYQKSTHWLPFDIKDESSGKTETKRKPIFNARVHSSYKEMDVIEKYIEFAKKAIESTEIDATKIKEKIDALYNWKTGISGSYRWVCYANVTNKNGTNFGRLELSSSVKTQMDKLAFSEEADEPIEVDPFTDPDTGFAIKVVYNNPKDVKPQDVYAVTFNTKNYVPQPTKLSDQDLEKFSEIDSLESMFQDVYTQKDLDKALEGLQNYDVQNKLGVMIDPAFIEIVEKLFRLYPVSKSKDDKEDNGLLPWETGEKAAVVNNDPIVETIPSSQMNEDEKAQKLAALKAKLIAK